MEPIQFKKSSWHYRFIRKMDLEGSWHLYKVTDLCEYLNIFMWSIIAFLLWSVIGFIVFIAVVVAIAGMGDALAWFAAMLISGELISGHDIAVPGTAFLITICVFIIWLFGVMLYKKYKENHSDYQYKPSFISLAYTSFKDKVCFPITFKD